MRPRRRATLSILVGVVAGVAAATRARRWLDAIEVQGGSMAPTLLAGDRLLVESRSFARRAPRTGELVLAIDPRDGDRELIKRVAAVDPAAALVDLRGDAVDASTDSRAFGQIPIAGVRWRAVLRYWPPRRARIL